MRKRERARLTRQGKLLPAKRINHNNIFTAVAFGMVTLPPVIDRLSHEAPLTSQEIKQKIKRHRIVGSCQFVARKHKFRIERFRHVSYHNMPQERFKVQMLVDGEWMALMSGTLQDCCFYILRQVKGELTSGLDYGKSTVTIEHNPER